MGRPVYALGFSAGGTIAEYLAIQPQIDGAVAVAPLSDLVRWKELWPGFWRGLGMSYADRYRWSPHYNIRRPVALRIVHSLQDELVPHEQSVRMVSRCGGSCELVSLPAGVDHAASVRVQAPVVDWFTRRAGRARFRVMTARPVISRAAVRPRTFSVRRGDARPGTRTGGTSFGYTVSEQTRVTFTVVRVGRRTRQGQRCPRIASGKKTTSRCRMGGFSVEAHAGKNNSRFDGKVRGRALRPGRYRAILRATSPSGASSTPRSLAFTIVKRATPQR